MSPPQNELREMHIHLSHEILFASKIVKVVSNTLLDVGKGKILLGSLLPVSWLRSGMK